MRTWRVVFSGAVVLSLLGAWSAVALSQDEETPTRAAGTFTVETTEELEGADRGDGRERGRHLLAGPIQMSDSRVDGTLSVTVDVERVGDEGSSAPYLVWGDGQLENEAGAWTGTLAGYSQDEYMDLPAWYVGEGAYEGLSAYLRLHLRGEFGGNPVFDADALIYEGLPPVATTSSQGAADPADTRPTAVPVEGEMIVTEIEYAGRSDVEEGSGQVRGQKANGVLVLSDARLTGDFTATTNSDSYVTRTGDATAEVSWGTMRVHSRGGDWEYDWTGGIDPGASEMIVAHGRGLGDHSDWSVRLRFTARGGMTGVYDVDGMVYEGEPPRMSATPLVVTPPDVAPPGAVLFDGFSDPALAQWVGKSEGAHSGEVLDDPLNPGNRVLRLGAVVGAGDMFSQPIAVDPGLEYALCFDYMGRPVAPHGIGNGSAVGIADGTPGNHRWLAGTTTSGGIEQALLVDDDTWQEVRVEFDPEIAGAAVRSFRIMLEDFEHPGRDVWFDDILLVPSSMGCDGATLVAGETTITSGGTLFDLTVAVTDLGGSIRHATESSETTVDVECVSVAPDGASAVMAGPATAQVGELGDEWMQVEILEGGVDASDRARAVFVRAEEGALCEATGEYPGEVVEGDFTIETR